MHYLTISKPINIYHYKKIYCFLEDTRNHIATSVYLSTNWHLLRKTTIQRCTEKDIYHFKTWVHVQVDHGGRFGLKNVTMYYNCEGELDFEFILDI